MTVCQDTGRNVFHVLARHPDHANSALAMTRLLAHPDVYGAAASAQDKEGCPPLLTAVLFGNVAYVQAMTDGILAAHG